MQFLLCHILLSFYLLLAIVYSKVEGADGENFQDDFPSLDKSIWHVDDNELDCNGYDCMYVTKSNLRFIYHPPSFWWRDAHSELQIELSDGCNADHCCDGEKCARFTGAALSTKKKYGYGSFEFILMAANGPRRGEAEENHVVSSCFSMGVHEKGFHEEVVMGISMCIDSNTPWACSLMLQYGDDNRYQDHFALGLDASTKPLHFRIDWHPNLIEFYADRKLLKVLKESMEHSIPDRPMHVNLIIVPQVVKYGEIFPDINFIMHVYRVKYRKFEEANEHVDLFVQKESSNFKYLLQFGLILFALLLVTFIQFVLLDFPARDSFAVQTLSTHLLSD